MKLSLHKHGHGRRKNRRVHFEFPVGVAIHSRRYWFSPRCPRFHGTARHASMSGLEVISESAIPEGAVVTLWISIVDDAEPPPLKLTGDVMWARAGPAEEPFRAGIRLHDDPGAPMRIWTELIADHIRREDS